jgi:hypothetical protein
MDELKFEGRSLSDLARDMRRAATVVRKETDKTVVAVGAKVAAVAKEEAGRHSKSIPPTIRLAAIPGAAVIRAGNQDTPMAELYEIGNKGGKRTSETFRHPVFGQKDVWVEQPRFRFLAPALAVDRRAITKQMEQAWDKALEAARIKP